MLEIKPLCENCGSKLATDSVDAMICSFECTFCITCVESILHNVCPNCGGGFEKRPVRPILLLTKYPASQHDYINPIDKDKFKEKYDRYNNIRPHLR